ncbi:LysR family transcriptional regulator [Kribbella sp. VKM Ac-2566]|uniref:LysR family transcriptional regulator n=1 Tax=Kribbella sp. VKM Ac-2566 TaxID=2512218 RepID=UPI0010E66095|nr:LysR family transcriptional regulator [Kribbella sp. VKM Ac-2566]TDW91246.1 DNA-binding transcriptional LysR family regulator [Kribbella sp. VKM Ac-2566]
MDLVAEDLQAFAVFAGHRNFTRAAEELHVSQPALHARIRKLEARLGTQLYVKHGRQLHLTDAGERLAAFANDTRDRTADFLRTLDTAPPRPLVLIAGSGSYLYLLADPLRRYLARGRQLRLLTGDAAETLTAVRGGTADVGVTALGIPPDDLDCELLAQFPQTLIVRSDHRLAGRRTVRLRDLQDEALVVPPKDRPHRQQLERSMLDQGLRWSVAVEAEGWELLVQFVRLGIGPAVVNGSVRTTSAVRKIPVKDLPPVRYYVVTRPGRDDRVDGLRRALT